MVNPGYPMQPMPPIQTQPPRVVRRGTSKAVPVVVSAGLAIGVFCGLLFGLGLPDDDATAATTTTTTTNTAPKPKADNDVPEPFQPTTNDVKLPPSTGSGAGAGDTPAAGSGSGSGTVAAGSGSGSGVTATPIKLSGKLTIDIKPESIAKTATILVDGQELEGNVFEVDLTDKLDKTKNEARTKVKVTVKASGYKDIEQDVEVVAAPDHDVKNRYEVTLQKRSSGGTVRPPRPPPPGSNGSTKPKCKKPPCGLIDI